ncbi:MAG: hypothetical protein L6Q72_14460 [Burkholderiaceae bacterium]|nr:hypothetical protein [Burkholderiaceae bacterium]
MTNNEDARSAELMNAVDPAPARQPQATRLEAALIDAARAIRAVEERPGDKSPEVQAMLARCRELHARARAAATRKSHFVAYDCLQQIERELVVAMSDDERTALMGAYLAEARAKLNEWRRAAADALAASARGGAPSVAVLQALMKNVHASQQNRQHKIELVQRQAPLLVGLLIGAVLFFSAWAGLLSVAFSAVRADLAASILELRWNRAITVARPFIGAAVAVPIVLFLQSGLVNLGSVTPALALALCFIGGFSERWFLAQVERIAGASEGKPK